MQTEAAVLIECHQPLRLLSLSIPTLKAGQVLVEVAYSGVCHSQLLETQGKRGPDRFLPHTLGHEGSGVVLETGPGVGKVKAGQPVVLSWIKGSGADVSSSLYQSRLGTVQSGALSTFMGKTVTCENRVTPIPEAMPLREASLFGCALPTGGGMVMNLAQPGPHSSLAVFGVGGIGLCAVAAARLLEVETIIAVDVSDEKLRRARLLGAHHGINASRQDVLAALRDRTGGRGVDCAIEAAGRRETMETAFEAVSDQGGLCVIAGNLPAGERITLDPFGLIRGKRIIGTWGGETQPDRDIPRYAHLYLSGKLRLDPIISHTFQLQDINQALHLLEKGEGARSILKLQS
ncbi:MAG: zinc-binding dehydrogenase [Acidobacteriota bacterium]